MSTPDDAAKKDAPEAEATGPQPVNTDFKDSDLDLNTVKKFVIGSFVVTLSAFILMLVVHRFYKKAFMEQRGGVPTAAERQIPGEDDALLQTQPLEDRQAYFDGEEEALTLTTNAMDHAVIPVESAKKLMLEEGFPTVKGTHEAEDVALSPMIEAPAHAESAHEAVHAESAHEAAPAVAAPEAPHADTPVAQAPEAAPAVATTKMVPKYPNPPNPAMVEAGKKIWDVQCMAACHTGKKGAIGPNIQKAFGTMRKLENHDPILMDEAYVVNSLSNPAEHIAKGYMPVMMSFKETLSEEQKNQVAAYLRSQGKEILVAVEVPAPAPAEPVAAPETEVATDTPAEPAPVVPVVEAPVPSEEPAAAPVAEPAAPAQPVATPAPASGPIFV